MESSAKVASPSPEEAAFKQFYDELLSELHYPVKFAESLLLEGVIGTDTKNSITSDADEAQKRLLLNSVQHALSQSSDPGATLLSAHTAMKCCKDRSWSFESMNSFVEGEYLYM